MKSKKIIALSLGMALASITAFAQVTVGFKTSPQDKEAIIKPEDMAALKQSTTVFILPADVESSDVKVYEQIFKEVWTFTPYKVITDEQIGKYSGKPGYSYITIGGITMSGQNYSFTLCFYELQMLNGKKNNKVFAQINIPSKFCTDSKSKTMVPINMLPGYLKVYLAIWNNCLSNGVYLKNKDDYTDKELFKNLENETLWIPDENLSYISNWGGKTKTYSDDEFFKKYPYPHKVATGKEISDEIMSSSKPVYFMGPTVNIYGHKVISIYSSKSNMPVFYDVETHQELSPSDMKYVAKQIEKAGRGK